MKIYLLNSFSLSMLDSGHKNIQINRVGIDAVKKILTDCEVVSAIGHADTASIISSLTGMEIPVNRISIVMSEREYSDDGVAIVAQYSGPRLPEGTKTLPEGASFTWFLVQVKEGNAECRHFYFGMDAQGRAVPGKQTGYINLPCSTKEEKEIIK
jgi:Domain of unknown function (DUF1874)